MAMILYDRGLLHLDAPVADLLPDFVTLAPPRRQPNVDTVTVRMLLAHSSGLPAYVKLFETAHTPRGILPRCTVPHRWSSLPAQKPSTATSDSFCWARFSRASPTNRSTPSHSAKSSRPWA